MNWEAIAAIGEILGATAVLVTIVYLAVQVRQNTASAAAATYDAALSGFNEINLAIAESEELTLIFTHGLTKPDSLSEIEAIRFALLMRAGMNQYMKLLRLYQRGALPEQEWRSMAREAAHVFQTPGGERFRVGPHAYECHTRCLQLRLQR